MKNIAGKKINLLFIIGIIFLLSSFSGCALLFSAQKYPTENKDGNAREVNPKRFKSPDEYGLAFGTRASGGGTFAQINPSMEAMIVFPMVLRDKRDFLYYLSPHPVGMHFHPVRKVTFTNNTTTIHYLGLQASSEDAPIIIRTPGLNYFGSPEHELWALNLLKKELRKTPWEAVIDARIKELER